MPLVPCQFPRESVKSQAFTCSTSQRGWILCKEFSSSSCSWYACVFGRSITATSLGPSQTPPPSRLWALTDLARGKSELVAENALLRQQLIILRRQVKRPACTKTDRMLLVLLASIVRTWKQALFIVQEDDAPAVASPGVQARVEVQVQGSFYHTKDIPGDRGPDQGDGE